jgi:hypothetical protein
MKWGIAYLKCHLLQVDLDLQPHTTLLPEKRHFTHHCFTVKDVSLPAGYHFGITGLSSGNTDPDSVDVYAFDAWEVTGKADGQQHSQPVIDQRDLSSFKPLAGTEDSVQEISATSLQEVITAQTRLTEAIDALARRIDAMQSSLDVGLKNGGGSVVSDDHAKQLKDISNAVSRLTGQSELQSGGMTAEELEQQSVQYIVKMITRLSADVNGISVRLDSLTTRVNKNIATIMNRIGEVFTLASRADKAMFSENSKFKPKSVGGAGGTRSLGSILKWLGGLVGCLVVLVVADRWRRGRMSGAGGRGRKMI